MNEKASRDGVSARQREPLKRVAERLANALLAPNLNGRTNWLEQTESEVGYRVVCKHCRRELVYQDLLDDWRLGEGRVAFYDARGEVVEHREECPVICAYAVIHGEDLE